jgi:molybdopterin-guanine dinucleotide biosynthesis protein A
MGTDKALLQIDGVALIQQTAALVQAVAGRAAIIGDPEKYSGLGYPVIADRRPGNGPLAGMEAALSDTNFEWNLIVACDMGSLSTDFLEDLCSRALLLPAEADCLIPAGPDGRLQPLSAIYRRRCLAAFSGALDRGIRKVTEVAGSLRVINWQAPDPHVFQNINTPEEWNRYVNGRTQ